MTTVTATQVQDVFMFIVCFTDLLLNSWAVGEGGEEHEVQLVWPLCYFTP